MKTVSTGVRGTKQVSPRLELLVRIFYSIPLAIVFAILRFLAFFARIVNWLSILVRGLRSVSMSGFLTTYFDYAYKFNAYASGVTDERPPILPE